MAMFPVLVYMALAAGHMSEGRVKRSDDSNALISLTTVVNQLSAQLNSVEARVNSLDDLETRLKLLETRQATLLHRVAFRAEFSQGTTTPPANAPLKFDRAIFNDGNAYDPLLGVFVAPVNGVYTFSVQVFTHAAERSMIDIYINGSIVSRMAADSTGAGSSEISGASTVMFKLLQGDKVWVQAVGASDFFGGVHSFFIGALMYAV